MSDILVIKTNIALKAKQAQDLRKAIADQIKDKVIILPWFCSAELVPEDVIIKFEEGIEIVDTDKT